MRALSASGGDPLSRAHFDPGHFTASAFVLSPDSEALLLVHHRKLGMWLQPGGHVDPEDVDLVAAARREAEEESGVVGLALVHDGIFDLDIHPIPGFASEPPHSHYDVRFLFQAGAPELQPSPEIAEARWVPLEDVATLSDGSVERAVAQLRSIYLR